MKLPYGFDETTKIMKLETIHPGISIEDIRNNCGFDIIIPDNVPTTPIPTREDVQLLRELDPTGMAIGR
ncbi:MAG: hypothetical protein ACTSRK_20435 [Promethearchaeota archaeon]